MSIDTDYKVLRDVLAQGCPRGWAIEFGVYTGTSLAIIAEHMPVIGLDSFDGLPEDWREGFGKGRFGDHRVLPPGRAPANAMVVPGLFSDTVPWLEANGLPEFGLVHIDCDLYSSTITALRGVRHHIRVGTFVVFDEYHGYPGHEEHEMKAWGEFRRYWGIEAEQVAEGPEEAAFKITGIDR